MRRPSLALRSLAGAVLLSFLLPLAAANSNSHNAARVADMDMSMPEPAAPVADEITYDPNYMTHPEHRGLMYAHIGLMVLAWVFILPVGKFPRRSSAGFPRARC